MKNNTYHKHKFNTAQRNYEQKNLAYYEHLLEDYLATRMEYDKSLLFISTGGIGLLITLLTTVGFISVWYIIMCLISCLAFLTTSFSIVFIFWTNTTYIRFLLNNMNDLAEKENNKLKHLRKITIINFAIAIFLALSVGTACAIHKL